MRDSNVIAFKSPSKISDALTEVLRSGAQKLLAEAVECEVEAFLLRYKEHKGESGQRSVVRNGYLPARSVQTGIGSVPVHVPRVRDRSGQGLTFKSSIIPPYLRRSKSIEELLPLLYLKGLSSGDFSEALAGLLGKDSPGLSASSISLLKQKWKAEYDSWQKRDLSTRRYVYFWADGIYFQARNEQANQCMLVIIGADAIGRKEVVAIEDGYRESSQSWKEILLDLKQRGLQCSPELAIGDGSLGFWKALTEVYGTTRQQRCWVHKTANILNKMPESLQKKAKQHIHNIWMAEDKASAESAFDFFIQCYQDKYPKATECLDKDRDTLLTYYDFPAKHWLHIRSTNVIESTFATVRLRTDKTRGCLSRDTGLAMVFKLMQSAQKRWNRLHGSHHMADIIRGVNFRNGIATENKHNHIQQEAA